MIAFIAAAPLPHACAASAPLACRKRPARVAACVNASAEAPSSLGAPMPDVSDAASNGVAAAAPQLYERNGRVFEELTWPYVSQLAARLVDELKGGRWDLVLAVTRGGLVPAALLAEGLGVRNVLAATVMFYTDNGDVFYGLHQPRFLAFPSAALLQGRRVLVVDDVWDSGRTARAVRERVARSGAQKVAVAVLHFKHESSQAGRPEFFAATTDRWVLYPWELLAVEHVKK